MKDLYRQSEPIFLRILTRCVRPYVIIWNCRKTDNELNQVRYNGRDRNLFMFEV